MDIYRLEQDCCFIEQVGSTLDTPERLKLELGLVRLTQLANADELLFWGRIETTGKPYYIAMAVDYKGHYEFPHKSFFWSTSNFQFEVLPSLLKEYSEKVEFLNGMPLTGNPKHILVNVTAAEGEAKEESKKEPAPEPDSDDQQVAKAEPQNLTELDRLAYIVRAIENDCQTVPVGAFRINQQHELRHNDNFSGLSKTQSHQLQNYQLFRAPQSKAKREAISKPECVFELDFMDSIAGRKDWSIQWNSSGRDVTLRNLTWPGFISYHRSDTGVFGGSYMGNGVKRVDLAFFL